MPGDYKGVSSSPTEESLPPYSSTWEVDHIDKEPEKRWNWRSRRSWVLLYRTGPEAFQRLWPMAWPVVKKLQPTWKQTFALTLVVVCGILPLLLLGHFVGGNGVFSGVFSDKIQTCGDSFGTPENATVTGIEKLFVLDSTFGKFSFSQAKTIDVIWDTLIGRGVQMLAWWIGYKVFSDALLRAIERHPASFEIFQRIALEGPSLLSLWTLIKEQWRSKSKRTKALFFYIFLSTLYIISIPMFLSAMTGYDSTSIAWVSLDDQNQNNIVAASMLVQAWIVTRAGNDTFGDGICVDSNLYNGVYNALSIRRAYCDCQLRNGTILTAQDRSQARWNAYIDYSTYCRIDFPGNNQTFKSSYYQYSETEPGVQQCATSKNITIASKTYDALAINGSTGYCYNSKPYHFAFLQEHTRCLPDTANPTYQWGFSTMLSGLFVFLHFSWALTMYAVWQDAQLLSPLVRGGYTMTPLRAAFAMACAARGRTGMRGRKLVRADTREMAQELYGAKGRLGTCVGVDIFGEGDVEGGDEEGVRRRMGRQQDGDEVELSGLREESGSGMRRPR